MWPAYGLGGQDVVLFLHLFLPGGFVEHMLVAMGHGARGFSRDSVRGNITASRDKKRPAETVLARGGLGADGKG